jgi:hypothetical protein
MGLPGLSPSGIVAGTASPRVKVCAVSADRGVATKSVAANICFAFMDRSPSPVDAACPLPQVKLRPWMFHHMDGATNRWSGKVTSGKGTV